MTLRHGEKKHYNHKVDCYSFAIVLWELIQNKLPFEGMSNLQAAYAAAFKVFISSTSSAILAVRYQMTSNLFSLQNLRPAAEELPTDLAHIVTSCWQEDPNSRPNFTQIINMLSNYLHKISPLQPAIPPRVYATRNTVLAPESPGTSALMSARDDSSPNGTPISSSLTETKSRNYFFCFNQCY